jgi:hypothetical protein
MKRKLWLLVSLVVVSGIASYVLWLNSTSVQLPPNNPQSIELIVFGISGDNERQEVIIDDPTEVSEFMGMLRTGRANEDHKCGDVGTANLNFEDGAIKIGLLPGHTARYYEFRYDRNNYRIDRRRFQKFLVGRQIDIGKLFESP